MIREAVILAGGFGTRLRAVVSDLPKPMAPVNGKPFLHYVLAHLEAAGIERVVLSVGYLADKIEAYFGQRYGNLTLVYSLESTPLGTGGGIRLGLTHCTTDTVLVLNGDSFFAVPVANYVAAHAQSGAVASLALRRVEDGARYGTLLLDGNRITAFREKSDEVTGPSLINGGVYLLNREHFLVHTPADQAFSIEYDFFARHASSLNFNGFVTDGYFIDIGIPEDYARAQSELGN
jgi:D-glycero-alpha-D-manno-heptose 1-phosphate guanylyltransferase